jgi:hypothetical protein
MKRLLVTTVAGVVVFVLAGRSEEAPRAVYTAAQAEAGRTAFQSKGGAPSFKDYSCEYCHTTALTGRHGDPGEVPAISSLDPDLQKNIQGRMIPALAGAKFMAVWGARTTQDLSRRVMLAAGQDEETNLNLTAYILQVNRAKPGAQPLTTGTAVEIRSIATSYCAANSGDRFRS